MAQDPLTGQFSTVSWEKKKKWVTERLAMVGVESRVIQIQ